MVQLEILWLGLRHPAADTQESLGAMAKYIAPLAMAFRSGIGILVGSNLADIIGITEKKYTGAAAVEIKNNFLGNFVAILTLFVVPAYSIISGITNTLPHLPGQADTWNIQYSGPALASLVALLALAKARRVLRICSFLYWVATIWNLLLCAVSLFNMYYLWGEMY